MQAIIETYEGAASVPQSEAATGARYWQRSGGNEEQQDGEGSVCTHSVSGPSIRA